MLGEVTMSDAATMRAELSTGPRLTVSKGLITIGAATLLLFLVSALAAPSSVSGTALRGMLPIASVLAVAGLGQMLVIQQGGIDLSVAGVISMTVVAVTHIPDGDNSKLVPAILVAVLFALGAGVVNGLLIGVLRLNPIIATLGTNALLYGADLALSGGRPRITTRLLARVTGGASFGVPHAVWFALGAQLLYCLAGVMLGGITAQPSAFEGDSFLLISVAVVVLGGTSLLGGRGYPLATVVAAVFLEQLVQFVNALGVSTAVQTIVQAIALAIGVSLYTVNWKALFTRLPGVRGATTPA